MTERASRERGVALRARANAAIVVAFHAGVPTVQRAPGTTPSRRSTMPPAPVAESVAGPGTTSFTLVALRWAALLAGVAAPWVLLLV